MLGFHILWMALVARRNRLPALMRSPGRGPSVATERSGVHETARRRDEARGREAVEVIATHGEARIELNPGNKLTVEQIREAVRASGFTPRRGGPACGKWARKLSRRTMTNIKGARAVHEGLPLRSARVRARRSSRSWCRSRRGRRARVAVRHVARPLEAIGAAYEFAARHPESPELHPAFLGVREEGRHSYRAYSGR